LNTASILIRDLNVSVRYACLFTVLDSRIARDGLSGYFTAFTVALTTTQTILQIFIVTIHSYVIVTSGGIFSVLCFFLF